MQTPDEYEDHKKVIDKRIKEGIDKLIASGVVSNDDFIPNEDGDKMIAINDEAGDTIIFNYTKERLYSYAGRLRDDDRKL